MALYAIRRALRGLAAAAALSAFAPAVALAQDVAAPSSAGAAQAAGPKLWVVRDADSTIYLFGALHFLRPETVWRSPQVATAFTEADQIWFEIANLDDPSAAALLAQYGLSLDRPLSSRLSPQDGARLDEAARTLGASGAAFEPMKPWLAGLQLGVAALIKAGYDPASGVELTLLKLAREAGKDIRGFETFESQIQVLDGLSEQAQVAFVQSSLDDFDDAAVELEALVQAWASGETSTIERYLVEELRGSSEEVYQALIVRRNAAWADEIEDLLDGAGTAFIAVGAGHLTGPDSVQAQLAARTIQAVEAGR